MDRLDAMAVLTAIVDTGILSGAARKLGAPLPTVSRKLSGLEAYLKTRLLTRSTRKLALTEAGAAYVAACKRILEQVREAERAAASEFVLPRGDLVGTDRIRATACVASGQRISCQIHRHQCAACFVRP
jgi:DNA-binding transcriptional LysR family regulator